MKKRSGLVVTRKEDEAIMIGTRDGVIVVSVSEIIKNSRVRIRVEAGDQFQVLREEVYVRNGNCFKPPEECLRQESNPHPSKSP